MTRKFAWWGAYGLAATALLASGALAEAVRLTASEDDLSWQDVDGKVRPSPVYTTNDEPPPPPPRARPRQGIGAGAESVGSPSDTKPKAQPLVEGPVQGYAPLQKNGYGPVQNGVSPLQKEGYAPVQNGHANPLQKGGDYGCGAEGPSCGYNGPSCDYAGAPSCGYDSAPSCGCDNAAYGDCFTPTSCCCWRWGVRAEAIFLTRSNAAAQVIATSPGGSINASGYDFDYEAGPRLGFFYHGIFDSCWDLELTYFGVHGWEDTQTLAGATVIATTPVINIVGGADVTSTYRSRLDSSEMNFRRQWSNWVTFLVGARWIEEGEILNNDIAGIGSHNVNVNNHLYGGQIGLDVSVFNHGGPWTVEGITKIGFYSIQSDVTTTTTGIGGGALPLVSASDTDTAFTADIGLTAVYQMTCNSNLRFGYNFFWIDGIAEAPGQMTTTNIATGVATVDQDTTQFYHGASIGFEFRR